MAYFSEHQLLFIHIPKNAGKSIEVALGLSSDSQLTSLGSRTLINRGFTLLQRLTSNLAARNCLHGPLDVTLCSQHLTLQEIELLQLLPSSDSLMEIRKFAVFRNPFDRIRSSFKQWIQSKNIKNRLNFEEFCCQWPLERSTSHNVLSHKRQQIEFIRDTRGQIGVDKLIVFDRLNEGFDAINREWQLKSKDLAFIGKQESTHDLEFTQQAEAAIRESYSEDLELYNKIKDSTILDKKEMAAMLCH